MTMCSQMAGAPASVLWPRAPPGLGPPVTFHVAALGTMPQDCPPWRRQPFGAAAHGWSAAVSPAPVPAWGGSRPALTEQLLAGNRTTRAWPSPVPAAAASGDCGAGPSKESDPPAKSHGEAAGAWVCSPGLVEPDQDETSWTHAWEVDSKVLKSRDSRVASREFQLRLPGQEPTRFVLMLNTHKESLGALARGDSSFKRAKGCGKVSIKCKGGPLETSAFGIALWLEGDGQACQTRDTVQWSFAERSMYEHGWWKLKAGPDQAKLRVGVQFTVATPASVGFGATPASPDGLAETAPGPDVASLAADCLVDPGPPPGLESFQAMGRPGCEGGRGAAASARTPRCRGATCGR